MKWWRRWFPKVVGGDPWHPQFADRPCPVPPCHWCGGPFRPGHGGMIGDKQFCTDECMREWAEASPR